jgi:hypothetical protein
MTASGRQQSLMNDCFWAKPEVREWPLLADSVEKVGFLRIPQDLSVKAPLQHASA